MHDGSYVNEAEIAERRALAGRLVLAAADMRQASAAARALQREHAAGGDDQRSELIRPLETGMTVCYARAFAATRRARTLPDQFRPADGKERTLHFDLMEWRHALHAHISNDPRRAGDVTAGFDPSTGLGGTMLSEHSMDFPPDKLDDVICLCNMQTARFQDGARRLVAEIDAPELTPNKAASS
jgi:hypothetical protein